LGKKRLKESGKTGGVFEEIDAGEDDFSVTGFVGAVGSFNGFRNGEEAGVGTAGRDDAVGTVVAAAGLDFEQEAAGAGELVADAGGVGGVEGFEEVFFLGVGED